MRDVAFEKIIAKLAHLGANATGSAGRPKEENAAKTHRQFHPRLPIFDRRRAGGENLERSVEEHRMQGILVRARSDCIGQSDAPCGLPGTGRQFADGSKFLAVTQAEIAQCR